MMLVSTSSSEGDLPYQDQATPLLPTEAAQDEPAATVLTSVVVSTGEPEEDEIQPGPANYGATDPAPGSKEGKEGTDGIAGKEGKKGKEGKEDMEDKEDKDGKDGKDGKEGKEGKKGKKGKTALEIGQKAVSDALKTDMAAERTFFKWLWTGLHTGAIGSFIFIAFDGDKNDPMRLVVVGFSWIVALCLVLYGTFAFYRRRRALRTGDITVIPMFTREHSPLVVVLALALVVGAALSYAMFSGYKPSADAAQAATAAFGGR